jgi:hypothetical protein
MVVRLEAGANVKYSGGATTLSITTLSITTSTLSIMKLSITIKNSAFLHC